jgi:hypothetical protein
MASPLAAASRGSVQQGLYAAGGFLGFSKLGLAADKRYSLAFICALVTVSDWGYATPDSGETLPNKSRLPFAQTL